ncbi:MAG: YbaK/EbsC family protein [Anaerovoracaceae bacterium]|jgi:prolyl-tRNA editing enzyme YbaK/EbsC (Cys-tRNA(Pro) deacylase)|nr:YbaK/EbsC family protein [Anaerovoracaceae bacterium]
MSIENVRNYFKTIGRDQEIIEFQSTTATVNLAADALGVAPARICKTISFKGENGCILVQTAGDTKINNKKFKDAFGVKAKMLAHEDVLTYTGHQVGGVCAFAITGKDVTIYCDESMKRFECLYPACGSSNSAIKLTPDEIYEYSKAIAWVDVCTILDKL